MPIVPVNPVRAAIEAIPVKGNAHSDMPLMNKLHDLIMDENAEGPDRMWALDYLSNAVMCLGEAPSTMREVEQYVQEYNEIGAQL